MSWVESIQPPPGRILDLGCATGEIAVELSRRGYEVSAVDHSPHMLRRARGRPGAEGVTFVQADLAAPLPESLGLFDAILLFGVLQCVPDAERVVRESRRHLVPGGGLLAEVKLLPSEKIHTPSHAGIAERTLGAMKVWASKARWVKGFEPPNLIQLLEDAGFNIQAVEATGLWIRLYGRAS